MFSECERCGRLTDERFLCELTGEYVCGPCEDEPNHDALHASAEGRDQFRHHGQCGACGAENVPLTYRLGLDLFVCLPCHVQPNLGPILVEEINGRCVKGRRSRGPIRKQVTSDGKAQNSRTRTGLYSFFSTRAATPPPS